MDIICVDGKFPPEFMAIYKEYGVTIPEQDSLYTIREVIKHTNGKTGLLLNEIKNPQVPINHPVLGKTMREPTFKLERFRTLLGDLLTKELLNTKEYEQIL